MTYCAICGSSGILQLETREPVPIAQNLVFPSRETAIDCAAGVLDMRRCTACGFVWNARFDPELLVYDADYDNDQNFSPRFRDHTDKVAEIIAGRISGAGPIALVEVGCGQGRFMAILSEKFGKRLGSALGFDPAWKGDADALPFGSTVRGEYFGPGSLQPDDSAPDVVVSRHVIEHVPDPLGFLCAIRQGIAEGTPLFIETPDIDWALRHGVFFDLYYEHCSLFTPLSLTLALERAGFSVEDVRIVFDEQYMIATAVAGRDRARAEAGRLRRFGDLGYRAKRDRFLAKLGSLIDRRRSEGKVALWGGASKGVTICLMLPEVDQRIDCVIDINERKQGSFMPASGIGIVSPAEAQRRGVKSVIIVNPTYMSEIASLCLQQDLDFALISIDAVETT